MGVMGIWKLQAGEVNITILRFRFFLISTFYWWPSWNKRNNKSAHFVAAASRGRLKQCTQTNATVKCFLWIEPASIDI